MKELEKADTLIVQKPEYVSYTCPKCGAEVEVDYDDFEDERQVNTGEIGKEIQ